MRVQVFNSNNTLTFQEAKSAKESMIWSALNAVTVNHMLNEWFYTLSDRTCMNYRSGIRILMENGILNPMLPLQTFSQINHDAVVDKIKLLQGMQETTKQARAALYISFTRFLSRRFPGIFQKAMPCREGTGKTFYRVHEKVVTEAMNQAQWLAFLVALDKINPRDCLIAKIVLQGGKRIREVLSLNIDQIDWDKREITFTQSKTKGARKETVITYPESVMHLLKEYIGDRTGHVFVSRKGKPVILNQVANTFAAAGKKATIPFKITPHVLRASCVTYLKQQGFGDSDIQKITGHASSEMVNAYDKSARADNASKKICLVN